MGKNNDILMALIEDFIRGKIKGNSFEIEFPKIFDFNYSMDEEEEFYLFDSIRNSLEQYTSNIADLNKYQDFYISEDELRKRISTMINER